MRAQTDWSAIARAVQPSIFTVGTDHGLGSGWVARTGAGGSDVITNLHVVAETLNAGNVTVHLRQGDRTIEGTITQMDQSDDLAIIHIAERFPALEPAIARPQLGDTVMAVGSPLGLGGSVSLGVISGFRSVDGADYMQFSAAISPGNSGGPVLDHHGLVVAVTAAKFTGTGVEALSLAIPVETVCTMIRCSRPTRTAPAPAVIESADKTASRAGREARITSLMAKAEELPENVDLDSEGIPPLACPRGRSPVIRKMGSGRRETTRCRNASCGRTRLTIDFEKRCRTVSDPMTRLPF